MIITLFIPFVLGFGIAQGYEDVCSLGADMNLNSTILTINGAWNYKGLDENNDDKPWWNHTFFNNILIDWGALYTADIGNFFRNKYVILEFVGPYSSIVLAYCDLTHTDPYNCDNNWVVYDAYGGLSYNTNFFVKNCSYFTVKFTYIYFVLVHSTVYIIQLVKI